MKRTALIRQVAKAARARGIEFELLRSQGVHDIYTLDGQRIPIPRHKEIPDGTVDGVRKLAESKLGRRWWR